MILFDSAGFSYYDSVSRVSGGDPDYDGSVTGQVGCFPRERG